MSRDTAIRKLAEVILNRLNGSELSIWLHDLELLAVVMPTARERNAMRDTARELCAARNRPSPRWSRQPEL
jgi:hypothetical protein